jgi:hypothetical protein
MSSTTEPPDDSSYPSSWTPRHIRERELPATELELHLASLSDDEFAALTKKVRGGER